MHIANPGGPSETITWNGEPEERAKAEAIFTAKLQSGLYLAYTTTDHLKSEGGGGTAVADPPAKQQTNRFDPEAKTTWMTPRLVGG